MRLSRLFGAGALLGGLLAIPGGPALAAEVTTPYPAVAVEPGNTATFDLQFVTEGPQRIGLEVTEVPEGWTASLRGGGFVIDAVFVDPAAETPPQVQLDVEVPDDTEPGTYRVVITSSAADGRTTLPLELRVAEEVSGSVTLATEFAVLQGASDDTFNFNLDLTNETPEDATFDLRTEGPEGWQIDATPAGQQQAAAAPVTAGQTAAISISVDPPDDAPAGAYEVLVVAEGAGQTAELALGVEITGNFQMTLSTPDDRLNARAVAGRPSDLAMIVINEGTAPLVGVQLTGTPPTGWEVAFTPELVEQIPPGEVANVTATITPASEAVAGDYVITFNAAAEEADSTVDIRTTVETSRVFGLVGLGLILLVLAGLGYVFQRYGRR